ncbi:MAG: hypothetical protein ACRDJW_14520 [Thermomicrobiales bacterium]
MARIALTAFIAVWALLGLISPAAAQDVDADDVQDLAGSITDKDPQQVLEAIQGDFNTDNLPDGFSEVVAEGGDGTPEATGAPSPTDLFSEADFNDAVGLAAFSVTADESDGEDGNSEAEAEGTLPAAMQSFDFYAIFYVVFENEDAARAALDEAIDDEAGGMAGLEVEAHEDFGVPGATVSGAQTQEGTSSGLGVNAVQVGNVLIMGIAAAFDATGEEINFDEVNETAENLTKSAILHLDQSVEDL